jgi:hypothetical protein
MTPEQMTDAALEEQRRRDAMSRGRLDVPLAAPGGVAWGLAGMVAVPAVVLAIATAVALWVARP